MKKFILKITVCMVIAVMCSTNSFAQARHTLEQIKAAMKDPKSTEVLVVSHRGDWRNAPENSLQAFQRVVDMGVDIIELDVQMSKDSVLVIMHDRTIDRTTSGKGKVSDYTLEELKKFTLRTGTGTPTRQHIPTLEEAMLLLNGKVIVNIDHGYDFYTLTMPVLKQTGTLDIAVLKSATPLDKIIEKHGAHALDKVFFMPWCNIEKQEAIDATSVFVDKKISTMVEIGFQDSSNLAENLKPFKTTHPLKIWVNSLWGGIDDEMAVDEARPDESWGWLLKQGATVIQTDRPAELIQYLKDKKYN